MLCNGSFSLYLLQPFRSGSSLFLCFVYLPNRSKDDNNNNNNSDTPNRWWRWCVAVGQIIVIRIWKSVWSGDNESGNVVAATSAAKMKVKDTTSRNTPYIRIHHNGRFHTDFSLAKPSKKQYIKNMFIVCVCVRVWCICPQCISCMRS